HVDAVRVQLARVELRREAGAELTLKGGGSFLKLDASGVTLSGANVRVNSCGSPGRGGVGVVSVVRIFT
ncbi:hypothetical protein ACLBSO_35525, partial [Klebsiella pneumoniae]